MRRPLRNVGTLIRHPLQTLTNIPEVPYIHSPNPPAYARFQEDVRTTFHVHRRTAFRLAQRKSSGAMAKERGGKMRRIHRDPPTSTARLRMPKP